MLQFLIESAILARSGVFLAFCFRKGSRGLSAPRPNHNDDYDYLPISRALFSGGIGILAGLIRIQGCET